MSSRKPLRPDELLGILNESERHNAPKALYCDGDTRLLQCGPRISVVGTRRPSEKGVRRVKKLASSIAESDGIVVSGLALGVDAAAHRASIEAGGRTIAVLGTALDRYATKTNTGLQEQIRKDHLLISQFAHGTSTHKSFFVQRNRTMALISDATVICEVGETSGTFSQAQEAVRLARPLFFLSSVADDGRHWVMEMLSEGLADVLTSVTDVLDVVPPPYSHDEPSAIAL
ncbi:MAG: DNA-processing protein DprA [Acidobacteriota bacterium]